MRGRKMTTYQFAGFWRRLVAYSIDGVIVGVVFIVLAIVAGLAYFSGAMSGDSQGWMSKLANLERFGSIGIVISALYALLFIAYFTYFHCLNGRTPGKKLLGLQVVSADGSPISFGIAFLRSVGYLVSSLLFTVPLGYIWAAFDKKKQGWHDKIAGTVVIIRDPQGSAPGITIPDSKPVAESSVQLGDASGNFSRPEVKKPETPSPEEATGADGQKIP